MADHDSPPEWLQVLHGKTIFEGDVLRTPKPWGVDYNVTRGGWNFDPGPDTWLTEHVLPRFEGHRVRITIEDLGQSPLLSQPRPQHAQESHP